jgi:hypothetical protein
MRPGRPEDRETNERSSGRSGRQSTVPTLRVAAQITSFGAGWVATLTTESGGYARLSALGLITVRGQPTLMAVLTARSFIRSIRLRTFRDTLRWKF